MNTVYCPSCHRQSSPQALGESPSCESCQRTLLLRDRWFLSEMLGHGASGYTWRAEDREDGSVVAIKELSFRRLTDFKQLELFEREAEGLRDLNHRGIPDYIDHFRVEEDRFVSAYLVQEFIDGEVLDAGRRITEKEVLRFLEEMADILEHLQSQRPPVVHRDIKPSNLMRRSDGSYVLIDFGSIRAAVEASMGGSTVAGTLGYIAPEQLVGRATVASDYYGLGATTVALIAGRPAHELIEHHQPGKWRDSVTVSEPLGELLEALLENHADQRLQTPQALRAAIERARNPPRPEVIIQTMTTRVSPRRVSAPKPEAKEKKKVAGSSRWGSHAWKIVFLSIMGTVLAGTLMAIPWLLPETIALLLAGPGYLFAHLAGLLFFSAFFALGGPVMIHVFMYETFEKIGLERDILLPRWLNLIEGPDRLSAQEFGFHLLLMTTGMLGIHVLFLANAQEFEEIYLVSADKEVRLLRQFSCGFDIVSLDGSVRDANRQRGATCETSVMSQGMLAVQRADEFVVLDAFTGDVLFSAAQELSNRGAFRVEGVEGTVVSVRLQDGSEQELDFGQVQPERAIQIRRPLGPSQEIETSLQRVTELIPPGCGSSTNGAVVAHYSTAFGDGDRLYSGLDAQGEPRWTHDSFVVRSRSTPSFTVGDKCWLYVPRMLGITEIWRLDPETGDVERLLRY